MARVKLAWVWLIALTVAVMSGCGGDEAAPGPLLDAARDLRSDALDVDVRSDAADARSDVPASDAQSDTESSDTRTDAAIDARVDGDAGQPSDVRSELPPTDTPPHMPDTSVPPDASDAGSCTNDSQCPTDKPHCNTSTGACVSVSSIGLTPVNPSIANGTSQQFQATIIYSDNSTGSATAQATWSSSDTSKATIAAGGLAKAVGIGSTTITATVGTTSGSTMLTVTAATLSSLSITPPSPANPLGTTVQFTATGMFSDGTTQDLTTQVTWTSSTTSVATIDAAGLASTVAVGLSTITAALGSASASTLLTVTGAALVSLAVTPPNPTIASLTALQMQVTGTYSDNTTQDLTTQATWGSTNISVAIVSNTAGSQGLVTGAAAGTSTITATVGLVTGTTLVTVTGAFLQSISITPANPTVARGLAVPFTATGTYSDSTTQNVTALVTWTSSNTSTAIISNTQGSQGVASTVSPGTVTITAVLGSVSGTTDLTVTTATLVSIGISPTNPSIAKGTTQQFTATGTYTDNSTQDITAAVTWSSSDSGLAPISNAAGSEGLATGQNQGSATITATMGGVTQSTTLTVTNATLASINVTPPNPSIAKGLNQQFTATGTYTDSSTQDLTTAVTWASSSNAVATISNATGTEGLANAAGVGTSTISATLGSVSGTTQLTVTAATVVSIQVTPTAPSIALGTTQQFVAIGTYTDSTTEDVTTLATWASTATGVAVVSNAAGSHGLAQSAGVGSATIVASYGSVSGSATLTVTAATLVSIAVTPTNPTIAAGTTMPFQAIGTYTDSSTQDLTTQVTWASSNNSLATISNGAGNEGLANGIAAGVVDITATIGMVVGTTQLTVSPATLATLQVTPVNPSIPVSTTQQFVAMGIYTDSSTQDLTSQVTWSSAQTGVATISNAVGSEGLASPVAAGTATITAVLGGVADSTTLTVNAVTLVSIAITPSNQSIANGTTLQYTATGTYSDASTVDITSAVNWQSSDATLASISNAAGSEGLATAVGVGGPITISATLGSVTGTTQLTVTAVTLQSITIAPATATIARTTSLQFVATGHFSNGTTQDLTTQATWSSSAQNVASISNAAGSEGLAEGKNAGMVTISAIFGGITGTAALTVSAATLTTITVTPASATINTGETLQYAALGTFSDGSTQDVTSLVTWQSSAPSVARVSNAPSKRGLATGVAGGVATITARKQGLTGTAMLNVNP